MTQARLGGPDVDERRHNMDGALFVDDDRAAHNDRDDERPARRRSSPPAHGHDDGKAEDARRITQGILDRMDLEARVHVREDDEQVVLDIDGPDAGRAIGKKGMTLEALQFLVNKIVNREPDERRHIVLDSGDYRERHDNGLVSMAKREAKRAITSGRPVTLEPMSARDRRVIHVSLAKMTGISTRSEGEGMERRLQIIPARGGERSERGARDDRPREGRSERRDDRPRDDRPREARDDRPREARDERPREARDERPREARDERPREARDTRDGLVERARDDRARSTRDARRSDRPASDRPAGERPASDRPASDRPTGDRATGDRPTGDRARPYGEQPAYREEQPSEYDDRYDRGRR
jgi:spoIIIJ-associated protein